jgi:hypothetical protein
LAVRAPTSAGGGPGTKAVMMSVSM